MKNFLHLSGVLLLVAALATGLLATTSQITAPAVAAGAKKEKEKALKGIFFRGYDHISAQPLRAAAGEEYFAVYMRADDPVPDFFALTGKGTGYNKSVPIELLVGFVNPAKSGVSLPGGEKYRSGSLVCAGWKVVKSQETPGLGENARLEQPSFTWWQWVTGDVPQPDPDRRTPFQKQFSGREPASMVAKENIDIITGATFSTGGIIAAIQDAAATLEKELPSLSQSRASQPAPPNFAEP